MDIQVADFQDYELESARLKKLAESYKKVTQIEEDRQTEMDDLVEASEQAFSEWQDNYTDWS